MAAVETGQHVSAGSHGIADEPAPEAERAKGEADWRHIANEWADVATNGPTILRNVRDGLLSVDDAIASMEADFARARAVHPAPPTAGQPEGVEALHQSTIEWLKQEIETAVAFGDDDGEAEDQRRVIHLQRLLRFARRLASAQQSVGSEQQHDTARLDYIERTFSGMTNRERYLPVQMIWGKGANGRTLREACDKYMARDAGNSQESDHA